MIPQYGTIFAVKEPYLRACGGDPAFERPYGAVKRLSPRTRGQSHIRFVLKCLQAGFLRGGQDGETRTGLRCRCMLVFCKKWNKKDKKHPLLKVDGATSW